MGRESAPGRWDPKRSPGALFDRGIYPVTLANLLFGEPDQIVARGSMDQPPVDTTAHYTFDYGDGRFAQLASSMVECADSSASIAGTTGFIRLPGLFWATQAIELHGGPNRHVLDGPEIMTFPAEGNGYVPMLAAVGEAIRDGKVQHPHHGRTSTSSVIRTLERIHAALGV